MGIEPMGSMTAKYISANEKKFSIVMTFFEADSLTAKRKKR